MKKFSRIIITFGTFLAWGTIVFAQDVSIGAQSTSPINSVSDVKNLLVKLTQWGFTFFFILAVAFILLAAYKYLMAKDNEAEVGKAQKSLKHAAIAIAIALVSAGVSSVISSVLNLAN